MNLYQIARIGVTMVFVPFVDPSSLARAEAPVTKIASPRIERFDLDPPARLVPGEALIFRITGSPRCQAGVSIDGVDRTVPLREVMNGIYEGAYTIRAGDQIDVHSTVTGRLRVGGQELKTVLAQPLVDTSAVAVSR